MDLNAKIYIAGHRGLVGSALMRNLSAKGCATYADIEELKRDVGFEPKTEPAIGIANWAEWYRCYQSA